MIYGNVEWDDGPRGVITDVWFDSGQMMFTIETPGPHDAFVAEGFSIYGNDGSFVFHSKTGGPRQVKATQAPHRTVLTLPVRMFGDALIPAH